MKFLWIPAMLLVVGLLWLIRRSSVRRTLARELAAKEELLANIKRFSGCFQSLLEAAQAQNAPLTQKILDIWAKRMTDYPALRVYFEMSCASCKNPLQCAGRWIEKLKSWEIRHDIPGTVFSISETHEKLYLFDDIYTMGADAKVLQPAWWLEAEDKLLCIETGTAEIQ